MKKLRISVILLMICIIGMSVTVFAESTEELPMTDAPSWDYEHNGNIPQYTDNKGNLIPNIYINEEITLIGVSGEWYEDAVVYCAKQGYLDGMFNRKYFLYPEDDIGKEELAVFLGRIEEIEYKKYSKNFFSDIHVEDYDTVESYEFSDWYRNVSAYYVNWAGEEGILMGNGDNTLEAYPMNREQAATILDRYIQKKTNIYDNIKFEKESNFKDGDKISTWAKDSVTRLSEANLFKGDQNGYFNPNEGITIAEICQFIFNIAQIESAPLL